MTPPDRPFTEITHERRDISHQQRPRYQHKPEARARQPLGAGPTRAASGTTFDVLLVNRQAEPGRHPSTLVEAERAGLVRRIDAEPDAVLAALPEAPERVAEERRADAAACAMGDG